MDMAKRQMADTAINTGTPRNRKVPAREAVRSMASDGLRWMSSEWQLARAETQSAVRKVLLSIALFILSVFALGITLALAISALVQSLVPVTGSEVAASLWVALGMLVLAAVLGWVGLALLRRQAEFRAIRQRFTDFWTEMQRETGS